MYLNGKDVNIDADFFVGLGADRDTMVVSPERIKELHYIKFKIIELVKGIHTIYSVRNLFKQFIKELLCQLLE